VTFNVTIMSSRRWFNSAEELDGRCIARAVQPAFAAEGAQSQKPSDGLEAMAGITTRPIFQEDGC
jgi:hypothetical protein